MTDFVIVIAAAAALAVPAVPGTARSGPDAAPAAAASAQANAPTVGFRTYSDAASCEQAAAALVARPGSRLVCVPVETLNGEMAAAY